MKIIIFLSLLLSLLTIQVLPQDKPVFLGDTVEMDEVVVTRSVPLDDNKVADFVRQSHASSMDDINARLGGVSLISRGEYAMEPMLNSFSAGQINVTIDGMKMFGACTGKMDPVTSYVEPVNLKSIDLSHGSNGAKNGSTIGGTFNMVLEKPEKSAFLYETGVNYQSVSTGKTGYLVFNLGREKWAYRLSGVYKHHSPYTDGNGFTVPFSQYRKFNLQQSLSWVPAKGHNITFDWLIDNARDVGYPALPMDVSKADGRIYSVQYEPDGRLMNIFGFKAKLYANTVDHQMDDSHRDSLYFVPNASTQRNDSVYMRMDMPGQSHTFGGYVEGKMRWSGKDVLSFKIEDYVNRSKADMTMYMNNLASPGEPSMHTETWPENQRQVAGLYLENSRQLTRKTMLSLDVRVDYSASQILSDKGVQEFTGLNYDIGKTYKKLLKSSNLNLRVSLPHGLKFKTGAGYGERLPTLSEQFGFYLFNALDGYDYIGNPDINPERALHAWAALDFTTEKLSVSLEGYYNHVFDYILGVYDPRYEAVTLRSAGVKQYENLKYATVMASNIQAMWTPDKNIQVLEILKYNFGQVYTGDPLPLIAPVNNLFSVTWRKPEYYLQTETEYSAPQHRINTNFGEVATPSYFLLNLRSGVSLKTGGSELTISFGIENVFNKAYSQHLDWGTYLRPGRNFYVGLKIKS